jgi:hypothetical protein
VLVSKVAHAECRAGYCLDWSSLLNLKQALPLRHCAYLPGHQVLHHLPGLQGCCEAPQHLGM